MSLICVCVDSPAQHLDHESRREFGHSGSPLAQSLWRWFEQETQSDCTSTSSALDWEESPNAIDLKVLQNALVNGTPRVGGWAKKKSPSKLSFIFDFSGSSRQDRTKNDRTWFVGARPQVDG